MRVYHRATSDREFPSFTKKSKLYAHEWEVDERTTSDDVRTIFSILKQNFRIILLTPAIILAVLILYVWSTTPLYTSKVEILIDPRPTNGVEGRVVQPGLGASAAGADTLLLESQLEVLRSGRVIDELIASENLTQDPEFYSPSSPSLAGFIKTVIKSVIYGPQTEHWQSLSPEARAETTLRKRMEVGRERNTYVIYVTVKSKNAEKSAHLASRIAEIYIDTVNGAASTSTKQMATFLSDKLDHLRTNASQAAQDVEQYRRSNGLIDTNQTLIVEQQLSDLNRELSQARIKLQSIEALRNQLSSSQDEGNQLSLQLSEFGESTVMTDLQTRLTALQSREAELGITYLPGHPELKRIKQNISAVTVSINKEQGRVRDRLKLLRNAAAENVSLLQGEVNRLEEQMARSNSNSVALRELEQKADTAGNLYENYLRRSQEAKEQVDLPSSTANIITPASVPSRPSDPKVLKLLASGMALGLVLGVAIAFLRHALGSERPATISRKSRQRSLKRHDDFVFSSGEYEENQRRKYASKGISLLAETIDKTRGEVTYPDMDRVFYSQETEQTDLNRRSNRIKRP